MNILLGADQYPEHNEPPTSQFGWLPVWPRAGTP